MAVTGVGKLRINEYAVKPEQISPPSLEIKMVNSVALPLKMAFSVMLQKAETVSGLMGL